MATTRLLKNVRTTTVATNVQTFLLTEWTLQTSPAWSEKEKAYVSTYVRTSGSGFDSAYPASLQVKISPRSGNRVNYALILTTRAVEDVDGVVTIDEPAVFTIAATLPGTIGLFDKTTVFGTLSNLFSAWYLTVTAQVPDSGVIGLLDAGAPILS